MMFKFLLIVNAALNLAAGTALVLVPRPSTLLMGLHIGPVGLGLARLLGCGFIVLGMLAYQLRDVKDPLVVRAILKSFFTGNLIAFIVSLLGQIFLLLDAALVAGVESKIGPMPKGGLFLVVFLVLLAMTGGYAYLLFGRKGRMNQVGGSSSPA